MVYTILNSTFGWEYVCFHHKGSDIIRRVHTSPNGKAFVRVWDWSPSRHIFFMDNNGKLNNGRAYTPLTFNLTTSTL